MPTNPDPTALHCPHPDCAAYLVIPPTLSTGEYACKCQHQRTVRLTWSTQANYARVPHLALVEKPEEGRRG